MYILRSDQNRSYIMLKYKLTVLTVRDSNFSIPRPCFSIRLKIDTLLRLYRIGARCLITGENVFKNVYIFVGSFSVIRGYNLYSSLADVILGMHVHICAYACACACACVCCIYKYLCVLSRAVHVNTEKKVCV